MISAPARARTSAWTEQEERDERRCMWIKIETVADFSEKLEDCALDQKTPVNSTN
jgi:hypothetical protein